MNILIDNDPLIIMLWKIRAHQLGVPFLFFKSPQEFFEQEICPKKIDNIYVDYYLDNNQTAEFFLCDFVLKNYPQPTLCTASESLPIKITKKFRSVIDKSFPCFSEEVHPKVFAF
jgi:hypothetical protein